MKSLSVLYLVLCGVWFGQVQVAGLFLLQAFYTAAIPAYILQTTAWLSGAMLGVRLGSRIGWWYWPVCGVCFFVFCKIWITNWSFPVEGSWALLFLLAVPAGSLFRDQLPYWENSGEMFGYETVGFLAGLSLSTVILMHSGLKMCGWLPFEALGLMAISLRLKKRAMA